MKIFALFCEPANYTLDLIRAVHGPRGVECTFLHSESEAGAEASRMEPVSPMPLLRKIGFFLRALETHDAFIVNGYTGFDRVLPILLNILFFRKPLALDSDTELRIPANLMKRALKWLWLRFLFTRRFCYGFAGGNFGHKDLFRHYGMEEERIFLMPMMVDNSRYEMKRNPAPGNPFAFGFIGRLVDIKQVDAVIAALRAIRSRGADASLLVVGDGPEAARLKSLALDLPVEFRGRLFGRDKINALGEMDCLVLYSSYESWGLVVNEALASGIPVVASDRVGANRNLVESDPPAGLVAKWNDTRDLADKMERIVKDRALWDSLRRNAEEKMRRWDYGLYSRNFDSWVAVLRAGKDAE